jgi:CheY-like chemotaxis protein
MAADRVVTILHIDDDPGYARLFARHFQRAQLPCDLLHFPDGQAALDSLHTAGTGHTVPALPWGRALLIVLDLHLPGLDGLQVLTRLKGDARTQHIPVFILTSEDDPEVIARCYRHGCNGYLTKPFQATQCGDALRALGLLLAVLQLPPAR